MKLRTLALTILAIGTPLAAQSTWIVDAAGGQHFTTVQAAVAAAAEGDTILVNAGVYTGLQLDIDKSLSILGRGTVEFGFAAPIGSPSLAAVYVHDLAPDQSFALRGVRIGGAQAFTNLGFEALQCSGVITLQEVAGVVGSLGVDDALSISFRNCQHTHIRSTFVRGGGRVVFENSNGIISSCVMEGDLFGPIAINQSEVLLDRSTITSGFPQITFGGPIAISGGDLKVSRSTIEARNFSGNPTACVTVTAASTITFDPTVTLIPANGSPTVNGPGTVTNAELSTLRTAANGSILELDLQGRAGATHATLLSFPVPVLPTPFGELWVDPNGHLVLGLGVLATRDYIANVPTTGLPSGLRAVVQSLVVDSTDFTLTNGTVIVIP